MTKRGKAIAMISGGLDSTLALALVLRQGIEVKAINFYTGFCITETQRRKGGRPDGTVPRNEALRAAADLEVEIEYVDISESGYLDMLVHPRYGYGANANPCVDCRIFMMQRAREIMVREGADFVFTGEVLGQRPKSQRRDTLRIIERESGLEGRLLCYLTDESFARKFFAILDQRQALGEERKIVRDDVVLLSTGRHFRLSPRATLIVGRTEVENVLLEKFAAGRARVEAQGVLGPVALVEGEPTWEERVLAARIVARYGKGKDAPRLAVEWREDELLETYEVEPERDEARIEALRI